MKALTAQLGTDLNLSDDDLALTIPSGTARLTDRVSWAKTYLKKAGLVSQPNRGEVAITTAGRALLAENPSVIDVSVLKRFPSFSAFFGSARQAHEQNGLTAAQMPVTTLTPDDMIAEAIKALHASLKEALYARIMENSPAFFERLVIELLLRMGYGGAGSNAGRHIGKSGDGGLDGLISEDRLGLDRIYLQAKRYKTEIKIGPEAVQAFLGALVNRNATKGVFITTSSFTNAAVQASHNTNQYRIVLVDGDALMDLLIKHDVGVRVANAVEIKRLDADYFDTSEAE